MRVWLVIAALLCAAACHDDPDRSTFQVGDCITPMDCPGHHCCAPSLRIVRTTDTGYLLAPSLSNALHGERFLTAERAGHFKRVRDECCETG